ncbi:Dehydrogenase, E1 component [Coprinopsis sp. MPI-PUGE-AT-0042]|nr:Dehydrogenase, E1 component [Coprinopsis sp. MPI-PUGE-AT-0042]
MCMFAMYGDGASNRGQVFEACIMPWNLPHIFVCVSNKCGMGASAERSCLNTSFYIRGDEFPGLQRSGHHRHQASHPIRSQWGCRPLILELMTCRYGGHSISDPGTYGTREEVQRMRPEPIRGLQKQLEECSVAPEQGLEVIDKEAKSVGDAAVELAKSSPEPWWRTSGVISTTRVPSRR